MLTPNSTNIVWHSLHITYLQNCENESVPGVQQQHPCCALNSQTKYTAPQPGNVHTDFMIPASV